MTSKNKPIAYFGPISSSLALPTKAVPLSINAFAGYVNRIVIIIYNLMYLVI